MLELIRACERKHLTLGGSRLNRISNVSRMNLGRWSDKIQRSVEAVKRNRFSNARAKLKIKFQRNLLWNHCFVVRQLRS